VFIRFTSIAMRHAADPAKKTGHFSPPRHCQSLIEKDRRCRPTSAKPDGKLYRPRGLTPRHARNPSVCFEKTQVRPLPKVRASRRPIQRGRHARDRHRIGQTADKERTSTHGGSLCADLAQDLSSRQRRAAESTNPYPAPKRMLANANELLRVTSRPQGPQSERAESRARTV